MPKHPYHSQLPAMGVMSTPPLDRWEGPKGVMIAWDVAAQGGLPPEFDQADVLYAEPPYPSGWQVFYDRLGRPPAMAYEGFIGLLSSLFLYRPGVMILGARAVKHLRVQPTVIERVTFPEHHSSGSACWFGATPSRQNKTTHHVIHDLSERYGTVGDFCAGYGTTGRLFAERGKRFVMSDLEPRCVGWVAENGADW